MPATTSPIAHRAERPQRAAAIREKLQAQAGAVLSALPVELAYLHGSVARGSPLSTSDIDLAVVLSEPLPPPLELLKLELRIQAAIEDTCGLREVDVRVINTAPITVQGEIVQHGICLFARDRAMRVEFESLTRRKYLDYLPTFDRMQAAFLERVRVKGLQRG
ncbi:MAG: nucleotidyltransferase domain-containing protein [Chloroflexi bacterium]|nr:nucleotidyltransferase domain-containing protein [Chloroflexota bacterium]